MLVPQGQAVNSTDQVIPARPWKLFTEDTEHTVKECDRMRCADHARRAGCTAARAACGLVESAPVRTFVS